MPTKYLPHKMCQTSLANQLPRILSQEFGLKCPTHPLLIRVAPRRRAKQARPLAGLSYVTKERSKKGCRRRVTTVLPVRIFCVNNECIETFQTDYFVLLRNSVYHTSYIPSPRFVPARHGSGITLAKTAEDRNSGETLCCIGWSGSGAQHARNAYNFDAKGGVYSMIRARF